MLTDKDIKNLTEYQLEVFKDVFYTKEDGRKLEEKVDKIQTTVDGLVKDVSVLKSEKTIIVHRLKNVENWIDEAAPKIGIKFKH